MKQYAFLIILNSISEKYQATHFDELTYFHRFPFFITLNVGL